jgi:hypothetical protein
MKPNRVKKNGKKGNPIPVRFARSEEKTLQALASATGLNKAEIIRRAGRYAFPRFLSREINILDVIPEAAS